MHTRLCPFYRKASALWETLARAEDRQSTNSRPLKLWQHLAFSHWTHWYQEQVDGGLPSGPVS